MNDRDTAIQAIRDNIHKHGFHIYFLAADSTPRCLYTIGLSEKIGHELAFLGGAYFDDDQAAEIVTQIAESLIHEPSDEIAIVDYGEFSIRDVDETWHGLILMGIADYYQGQSVRVRQIVPDDDHETVDIPDMSEPYCEEDDSAWKWLTAEWCYPIASDSIAVTNLDALQGYVITEVTRWSETQWEMFSGAGPDVDESDIRLVPMATLLGVDPTLAPVTRLDVEAGLWRDDIEDEWTVWE
ncbi:DUF4262 domain-containing protein [Stieleria varia]|uniref:DUF4262 domain-containing protein n=1 Tax=Stieleria varia TaxID=2528005 RepID=A0A5C6B746_9BACT|nr:DUF4262 domain-containing protein [Stieleria varia]TWU07808.1 hypothetical protein Pla52n_03830 [Stieleria varia]